MDLDFVTISSEYVKKVMTVSPEFIVNASKDLMIRGRSFYAIWNEKTGLWSTDEGDVQLLVDDMIMKEAEMLNVPEDTRISKKLLKNFSSNKWSEWQKFSRALPDRYHNLDEKMIFSNQPVKKTDFVTRTLPYPLEPGNIESYNELMDTLYAPEEREKLEWAIGAIIKGDSKKIQKFIVLYGAPGTGKSTILNIIQMLFPGYYALFEAKELTGTSDFALESLKENSLIGIQHDGDLSRIEDNTRLNSIVSHEEMIVNEKFKSKYKIRFNTFLFMGTNKPVRITDAKSGIVRRLIDVVPTGEKVPRKRYEDLMDKIPFELSGIAYHCLKVYEKLGNKYYDSYVPKYMIDATNDFYNFIMDNYELFLENSEKGLTLRTAWKRYKEYCEDAMIQYPMNMRYFKTELKNYFREYHDRLEGSYSVYRGFLEDKFESNSTNDPEDSQCVTEGIYEDDWLDFREQPSVFDTVCEKCQAQYTKSDGTPLLPWEKVTQTLGEIDTSRLHYVRVPEEHIVIDFDIRGENGEKSLERNLEAARKWPKTYAEVSKSGSGIHLHYFYKGDVSKLRRVFDDSIEIKVFTGKASLRRMLTKCNNVDISEISSGLPLREVSGKMVTEAKLKSEKALRDLIERNLRKEIHPNTKPSIDFIYDILEGVYKDGMIYDVKDMRPRVQALAMSSTHQADYCLSMVSKMKFASEEQEKDTPFARSLEEPPIVIFDVECIPGRFGIAFKRLGEDQKVIKLKNPTPEDVEKLVKFRLIGFNNRDYDNHMLYARMMGYNNDQMYNLSKRIITEGDRNAKFGAAYNLSYTDIWDYMSAANKSVGGLKKWEIKLGIHHQECPYRWDEEVTDDEWDEIMDYCGNDVIATEKVFYATEEDFKARCLLARWAGMTPNDTTNQITMQLVFGDDKNPQREFNYPDLSKEFPGYEFNPYGIDPSRYNPGVKIVKGKSIYKGKDPGEGGYAIGYPGIYWNVDVFDIESMHPSTMIELELFGKKYTMKFADLKRARVLIKHGEYEECKKILPEELHEYLDDPEKAEELSTALKTPINSAYGLTSANFPNRFKDPRNVDNVVAKRGALFMINLEEECTNRGWKVVHIKTDSIKIANCTSECKAFIMEYGKKYGYNFEHESRYSRIALMNDAVYIAKYETTENCEQTLGFVPKNNRKHGGEWTATGTQFAVPYVFKSLFSKEPITFADVCETKSVTTAMYLDFNEGLPEGEHDYRFVGRVGSFVPVQDGMGGGVLLREQAPGKYSAVNGTKVKNSKTEVYRWLETEMAQTIGLTLDHVDLRYHDGLVQDAVKDILKYGDFETFVNGDESWLYVDVEDNDGLPFHEDDPFPMNKPEV